MKRIDILGERAAALWLSLLIVGFIGEPGAAAPIQLVVPAPNANAAGNTGNRYPFAPIDPTLPQSFPVPRYQQVYDGDALNSAAGLFIDGIAFRADNFPGGDVVGGFVYSNIEIRLSTSLHGVDALSSALGANVGPDELLVFSGPYTLPTLEGNLVVNPFDLKFDFATPFKYQGGDLLVDIKMPTSTRTAFYLDAVEQPADAVSRVVIQTGGPILVDSIGLVTQFTIVPEPSHSSLLLMGVLLNTGWRRLVPRPSR